jgi:arylsulfatase A-like enzyme
VRPLSCLALALLAGCASGRSVSERPGTARELLSDRLAIAEKRWDGILVEFGLPSATPLLEEGWSYGEVAPDGSSFRWAVADRASFRFTSDREGPHVAFVECEPYTYEGGPSQWVSLVVNGAEIPPLELSPGRNRPGVPISLRRGENEVEMTFRFAGAPLGSGTDKRRLAVAFHRFEVPFAGGSARMGPFATSRSEEGKRRILLPPGGSLSFFLELPDTARLRVSSSAEVTVLLRSGERELLRERIEARSSGWEREVFDLPHSPLELRFESGAREALVTPELFVPEVEPPPEAPASLERPDIVLVVLDGASALRTGLYGGNEGVTPVLDALARESVVFDVAVTQAVYTVASIGSLLTGQYPDRHQSVSFADRLRDDVVTFPALLSRAGYRTAAFPANAVVSKVFGLDRGYQEFFPVWERKDYTGHGDSVVSAFGSWLEGAKEPFFAYLHFREPHFPYNPPPPFDTRFGPASPFPGGIRDAALVDGLNRGAAAGEAPSEEVLERLRGLYLGNLAYADSLLGEILERVEERRRETVVIVTADHGEAVFEHGFLGHNTQLYEESIRIPLLIRAPGVRPRRVSEVAELLDLTPTLLSLAGIDSDPAVDRMQGRSLVPVLRGESQPQRIAFTRTVWAEPRYSARGSRYKLIWDSHAGDSELYDLESDPRERESLVGKEPIVEGHLRQELFRFLHEQERLKSTDPPPEGAVISDDDRRVLESLGYADQVPRRKEENPRPR